MLLSNDSSSHVDNCNLANEINSAFLQPQQELIYNFVAKNKLDTIYSDLTQISHETTISKQLNQSASKSCGPENIPNWV